MRLIGLAVIVGLTIALPAAAEAQIPKLVELPAGGQETKGACCRGISLPPRQRGPARAEDEVNDAMAYRLNGWQRLWIVVSILYLVPLAVLTLLTWPSAAGTTHRDEFITRMPVDLRAHVDAAYASEWDRNQHKYPGSREVREKAAPARTTIPPPPDFVLVSAPVSFPNGAVLDVHVAKDGDTEPDRRVGPAYWAVVQAEANAARWARVWWAAVVWLIPCLMLYALGWAVGWVRRGFREAK